MSELEELLSFCLSIIVAYTAYRESMQKEKGNCILMKYRLEISFQFLFHRYLM